MQFFIKRDFLKEKHEVLKTLKLKKSKLKMADKFSMQHQ